MNLLPHRLRPAGRESVLDRLVSTLRDHGVRLDGEARVAAVIWTDPGEEWSGILPLLRDRLPELLVLGDYDKDGRTGPAIWMRCEVDPLYAAPDAPDHPVPILYLPKVQRQQLRASDECGEDLKPLVELLYRGAAWHHENGKDWTPVAFFRSKAIGLEVADDRRTAEALRGALHAAVLEPIARFQGRRLEARAFDELAEPDLEHDVLRWMEGPALARDRLKGNWTAFRSRCRDELNFDPDKQTEVGAGQLLGTESGAWLRVWTRFSEAPDLFPGIEDVLLRSQPSGQLLLAKPERWPAENERQEKAVGQALSELGALGHRQACELVEKLEQHHGERRDWVWARLGRSPLARALEPLARLAGAAKVALGGVTPDQVAATYLERGWRADAAAWEAVVSVRASVSRDKLVSDVVRQLLRPWLEDSALAFQKAVGREPLPGPGEQPSVAVDEGGCLLFVDGLRYDLGHRLAERLDVLGLRTTVRHRWAALPTVTATSKPAISPVAGTLGGGLLGEDLAPFFTDSARRVEARGLREALARNDYQILGGGSFDAPRSADSRGWVETGEIDHDGHARQAGLAHHLPEELDRLADRIARLLQSGWRAVRVVTDHGWLLLPGGLPKADLPKHLTETRWARCAVIAGGADPDIPRAPWYWNPAESFAYAPGICCFNKSDAYAHGGVSVQECLVPDILVEPSGEPDSRASVESVTWVKFRCLVSVAGSGRTLTADLRLGGPAGESVAQTNKPIDPDGSASLLLNGDEHEESELAVVLLDSGDRVVAHRATRVGENS